MIDEYQDPRKTADDGANETPAENTAGSEQTQHDQERLNESMGASAKANGQPEAPEIKDIWPQLRLLLVFQIKLYIDAARDLLMSPLSIVVFIVDAVQGNRGDKSLFESLLQFGRRTEKAINLFNQHDVNDENFRGIDSILMQVEDAVRKEYSDGSVSANARESIEKSLGRLRTKLDQSKEDDE